MFRPLRFALSLGGFVFAPLLASAAPWPHEASDLPASGVFKFGVLPNGLHYAVATNSEPRGRVALRLLVRAGSLHETEGERGLAHFVEHMAFNGTRLFPRESLVGVLQRHGFAFGADVSAFTFPTHTIYQLDVPAQDTPRLTEGLTVLREFADGQTFDPAEIDRERGVIQSERRARDGWQTRSALARERFLYPLSLLSRRSPIGDEETVRRAGADELRAFYERWYRADNLCVIAVGDLPVANLEQLVTGRFATLAAPTTPLPPSPDLGWVGNPASLTTTLHGDPEAGAVFVELSSVLPGPGGVETAAWRSTVARRELVAGLLNSRLSQLRREHGDIFGYAGASSFAWGQHHAGISLGLSTSTVTWSGAVEALAREWRRAHDQGFTAEEIAETVRVVRRRYAYAMAAQETQSSRELADRLAGATANDGVFSAWTEAWPQMEAELAAFTPERAQQLFRDLWKPGAPRLFVSGNLALANPEGEIAAAYESGLRAKSPPPPKPGLAKLDYAPSDQPGVIKERRYASEADVHLVQFANGVRLNLKRTTYNRNLVYLRARVGYGALSQSARLPGLSQLATPYVNEAGVGRHLGTELRRYFDERAMSLAFAVEEDAFTFTGGSDTPAAGDLLLLLSAYLDDLAWRRADFTSAQRQAVSIYNDVDHEVGVSVGVLSTRFISGHDPRFALAHRRDFERRNFDELLPWLDAAFKSGPLELSLIGDFDLEAIVQQAARTVGTLPRRAVRTAGAPFKPIPFHEEPYRILYPVATDIPRAALRVQWPVRGCGDIHRLRGLEVLADILADRVRREIREKLGATYDPNGLIWSGSTSRDDGYLIINLSTPPADAVNLANRIATLARDFAKTGATDDELQAALQPRLADNASRIRDNGYWLYYVLQSAQSEPVRLDWPRTRESDFRTLRLETINQLAKRFLSVNHLQMFIVQPEAKK